MSSAVHPEIDLTAHCDCGAVTVTAKGRVVSMFHCACTNCQRVSGTGHSSVALLSAASVSVAGETKSHARPADSGATFTRHFCPLCATTVLAGSSRAPDLSILPVGLFAGQNDWFVPNQLIFSRSHPHWDLVADHLPRHQAYRNA
jgi:hypothetical protein